VVRLPAFVFVFAPLLSAQTVILPVTGAPYCGDAIQEQKLTLIDGTHISRTTYDSHVCRDSAGRERIEVLDIHADIQILDPVAGFSYRLNAQNQIAHRAKLTVVQKSTPELKPTVASLGEKTIEGVRVTGTLEKKVYPTGSLGNDQPFTVSDEIWLSRDLQVRIRETRSDPRSGDQVNQLKDLKIGEPDPHLFQVPPGFQIVDEATQ
jgi:hypothetical protein